MPRKIPEFESDSETDQSTTAEPAASSTRREAMGAGGLALAALFGGDWLSIFGDDPEAGKLQDSGDAVIDLDDINGVDIRNGLDVDKDAGQITIDSQAVEQALISALDGGTEVASAVDGFDFGTDLDVTDNGDGTVTIDYAGSSDGGGGGPTEVASGTTTVQGGSQNVQLDIANEGDYLLTAYPDPSYSMTFSGPMSTESHGESVQAFCVLHYDDGSENGWYVRVREIEGIEITVTWTVYEL